MTVENEVSPADSHSVDSDEPFRYACPDCGTVSVERRFGGKRGYGKTYSQQRPWEADEDRAKEYYCKQCQTRLEKVLDKKNDALCQP